ncbi:MAG: hypothetical protein KDD15_03415, partial [Lewinella sp.]|nr:hypothetical protein [Lewinella sp.]
MARKQISNEEALDRINGAYDQLESHRIDGLEELHLTRDVKMQAQTKERERLVSKYGKDHPRVKKIDQSLKTQQGLQPVMETQVAYLRKKISPIGVNAWRVQGRVLKSDRITPVEKVTVSLFDEQGNWIRQLGYDCTDAKGLYQITYDPDKNTATGIAGWNGDVKEGPKLYLTVTNSEQAILHREEKPVIPAPGQVDVRDIVLSEEACAPPVVEDGPGGDLSPGGDEPSDPAGREIFLASGKLIDNKSNTPLAGMTVQLLDTKETYTGQLGSTTTDEEGYFEFRYAIDDIQEVLKNKPDILVMVTDSDGKTLYRSRKAFKPYTE